jgi:UDPglucose 6-dehydrogenase
MKVTIIGTGYVGLTTGLGLAYLGHDVTCVDTNPSVVARLSRGEATIFESGLPELLNAVKHRIAFCEQVPPLVGKGVVLIAVGTPTGNDGDADLRYVDQAARDVAAAITEGADLTIVNKSTVPLGSARHVEAIVHSCLEEAGVQATVRVASNPEFLAEGRAVRDTFFPDRIVIGADAPETVATLHELYEPLLEQTFEPPPGTPRPERYPLPNLITTSTTSAELTKYAANSFLATKISFINEFAGLAERVGADITEVARAIGLDERIGRRFLHAGIGWGGSCFGKDTSAILAMAQRYDYEMPIVKAAIDVNYRQRLRVVERIQEHLKVLRGTKIGLLGLAFKGNTDDMRDAPALSLIEHLAKRGARVVVHDPVAMPRCQEMFPKLEVEYCEDEDALVAGCDAVVVVTDWDQYRHLDWKRIAARMRGRVVVDARNLLTPATVRGAGLRYVGVGR